jgi:hypothetical protein
MISTPDMCTPAMQEPRLVAPSALVVEVAFYLALAATGHRK